MKKTLWLALILLFVCVFAFSACDESSTNQTPNDTSNSTHTHFFEEWIAIKKATCTEDGVNERYCSCGEKQTQTISAYGHAEITDSATASTCQTNGKSEGKHCSVCGMVIIVQNELPLANHTYDDENDEKCNICGNDRVLSCKHTNTEVLQAVASTCTSSGLTEGKKCTDCGEVLIPQVPISLKEHTSTAIKGYDSTCSQTGLTDGIKCSVCGTELEKAIVIPVKSHEYTDKYDESCNKCGFVRDAECAHTNTSVIAGKNATCTEAGLTDGRKCTKCGEILINQTTISKLGHVEVIDASVAATCTTDGKTEGKHCSRCNATLVAQTTIGKLGHVEVIDAAVAATCTTDGKTEGKHCSRCNEVLISQQRTDATWHKFDSDQCSFCKKTCEELCVNYYDMSSESNGTIMGYIFDSPDEIGFYHMYVIGEGKMKDYSASKSPIKLDGYGSKITRLIISEGITSIGNYTFEFCDYITMVDIPNTVTSIGHQAFYECDSLTYITLSENIKHIGDNAFSATAHYKNANNWYRNMYYVDDVLVDAKSTISGNHTLKAGTKTIVERAFYNCSELTGITIPNTVVAINQWAFYGCTKLSTITFEENSKCTEIGYWAFYGTKIKSIVIPQKVTNIDTLAFYGCSSLENIDVEQGNTTYKSIDGVLFNYDVTVLLTYPRACDKTQYTVPSTVTKIEKWAFAYASKLTSITISASVSEIGANAFSSCSNLKTAIFENPVGWTMYKGLETIEMTESRMENAALYLTHEGMAYYQYAWIRQ